MTAYAIARLTDVDVGPAIREYLERIDDTLAPFEGRFIIHGGPRTIVEGSWREDLIVVRFPTLQHARDWYGSAAYQAILPLRTQNSLGDVILMEGVDEDHKATDVLSASR
ncbi:DUF1330 domain-containing protein [Cupriavidus sp. AU9028]|uniref:DUF1330 domain-containing protein n=1 Tax=Cupriavidus sp. AU9028 TaxID=2871157 RepID=UPI001C972853|nr:DUF1330 domain-containing protein [Cupriavidus sp. AU9028]MBY4897967.1 DUF1330 domain-containing protein [Cupriavidus sp. AU9028]